MLYSRREVTQDSPLHRQDEINQLRRHHIPVRNGGPSEHRTIGAQDHRSTGPSEHRLIGEVERARKALGDFAQARTQRSPLKLETGLRAGLGSGQDLWSVFGHQNGVFKLSRKSSVLRSDSPAI
jgi:hypothetical protein